MSDDKPKPKPSNKFIADLAAAHPLFWLVAATVAAFLFLRWCAP